MFKCINRVVMSDEHLYSSIKYFRELYGSSVKIVYVSPSNSIKLTEEDTIFARAAAKFQHLIIENAF
jgi:hypothetical protein